MKERSTDLSFALSFALEWRTLRVHELQKAKRSCGTSKMTQRASTDTSKPLKQLTKSGKCPSSWTPPGPLRFLTRGCVRDASKFTGTKRVTF
jgi:hypothetical protein